MRTENSFDDKISKHLFLTQPVDIQNILLGWGEPVIRWL